MSIGLLGGSPVGFPLPLALPTIHTRHDDKQGKDNLGKKSWSNGNKIRRQVYEVLTQWVYTIAVRSRPGVRMDDFIDASQWEEMARWKTNRPWSGKKYEWESFKNGRGRG